MTVTTKNADEIIAEKDAEIAELTALVKYYEEQLRLNKHRQFGASSEKGEAVEQLGLFDEAENAADPKRAEPDIEEISYKRHKRVGKRDEDLSGLPTEVVEHDLPEAERVCPECGGGLRRIGEDVRRELEIIPARVKVIEHRRAAYACRDCETNSDHATVVHAPAPEPVIKGSIASPSAIAHIMTQKYVMAVPLYRQEQNWLRDGLALSRQTMANWVIRAAEDYLRPIYALMRTMLLRREVLHADETTCQVLREPGKKANTNSFMWLYQTSGEAPHPIVLYEYQATRSSSHPKRFLEGWEGYLHADGDPAKAGSGETCPRHVSYPLRISQSSSRDYSGRLLGASTPEVHRRPESRAGSSAASVARQRGNHADWGAVPARKPVERPRRR